MGLGLRVWNLASQSFWWDEAFTWQTTSHGWQNVWLMLLTGDRNPPLYFLNVAAWGNLAGWSEFGLRFVSVMWSLIGLAFVFDLTHQLYNRSAGWWALALAAVSPALVVYAQEARMYSAFFALTAATLYFAWRVYQAENQSSSFNKQKFVAAFLLCEASLLLTHYFAIPIVAAVNLFALIVLAQRHATWAGYVKWFTGQLLAVVPSGLWMTLLFSTPGSLIQATEAAPQALEFVQQTIALWLAGVRDLKGASQALVLLGLVLLLIAILSAWRANPKSTRWAAGFWLVSLSIAYLMGQALTAFHPRYLLPYCLPLFVLAGGAVSHLTSNLRLPTARGQTRRTVVRPIAAGSFLALSVILIGGGWSVSGEPQYAKDDARGVAAYLKQNAAPQDVILIEANDYTLKYYDHGPAQTKMITATTEAAALSQLVQAIGPAQRVWLVHWPVSTQDPRRYWPFLLEQSGQLKDWQSFQGYEVYRYDMQAAVHETVINPAATSRPPSAHFDKWSGVNDQSADGALAVAIRWHLPGSIYQNTSVSLRLKDTAGIPISSVDMPLLPESGKSVLLTDTMQTALNYYVLPIPPGTPPLTYTLSALMYIAEGSQKQMDLDIPPEEETLGPVKLSRRLDISDPYRTLAHYHWQTPANAEIEPGVKLEAFAIGDQTPLPEQNVDVTLRWRKTGNVHDAAPHVRLTQANRVWNETTSDLFERDYPIGQWAIGETVIDRLKIAYPPVRGPIALQIGQGDQWLTLATLHLDESQLRFDPPTMSHAQSARFGDFAELLGFDVEQASLSPERPLGLTLYWRAANTEPITAPYTVFTQILAPDGHLVAQHDAPPAAPTTQWTPGQIVTDFHSLTVSDPAYRGPATLIIGWYNSASIQRVPVEGGGDHVTLQVPVSVGEK